MKGRFFAFINKHPIWVIAISITFAFIATTGAQHLVFKSDYRVFFGENNPELMAFESMQNTYNKIDNVSFVIAPKNNKVFTVKHLESLKKLTKESWQVPHSTRVDSLTNFQYTYAEEDDMIVENLVQNTNNLTASALAKIKKIALNEPLLLNKIVSPAGHVSIVNVTVQLPGIDPTLEVAAITTSVRAIKNAYVAQNPDVDVYLSGMVMMNSA
ncbi:MAG: RND family transporter, partial [Colwellia sp.]